MVSSLIEHQHFTAMLGTENYSLHEKRSFIADSQKYRSTASFWESVFVKQYL